MSPRSPLTPPPTVHRCACGSVFVKSSLKVAYLWDIDARAGALLRSARPATAGSRRRRRVMMSLLLLLLLMRSENRAREEIEMTISTRREPEGSGRGADAESCCIVTFPARVFTRCAFNCTAPLIYRLIRFGREIRMVRDLVCFYRITVLRQCQLYDFKKE